MSVVGGLEREANSHLSPMCCGRIGSGAGQWVFLGPQGGIHCITQQQPKCAGGVGDLRV